MRRTRYLLAGLLTAALIGGGYIYAQPQGGDGSQKLPDVTAAGGTTANLSPQEMTSETKRLLDEMEKMYARVLELQAAARKSKDVIKLNCVNEKLLAVKQLLNIAESAQTDLSEAVASGNRDAQVHQYGQAKLAHERATAERDEAEGCIGEEIVFIGPTKVDVKGPVMPDDPTQDPHNPFTGNAVDFERPIYATPFD